MAEKLEFDLIVKNNELKKSLQQAATYSDTLSASFAGGLSPAIQEVNDQILKADSSMGDFTKTTLGVAAGNLVFQAMSTAINFVTSSVTDSISAFAEQEDAINKLGQSLNLTGSNSQSAIDGVTAFASALEATSKYSDDAIIGQVAFARSLGLTTAGSQELVQAAANLSATLGGTLEENVDKLGKTLSGSAGRLAAYIPELKSLTTEQLKAGDAARVINEKFGGAAQNDLKTYTGSMTALGNAFNNLQESVGGVIVQNGVFQRTMAFAKKVIDDANQSISTNNVLSGYTVDGQTKVSKTSSQLGNDYETLNQKVKSLNVTLDMYKKNDVNNSMIVGITDIKKQIDALERVKAGIEEKLKFSRTSSQEKADVAAPKVEDNTEKEIRMKRNAELLALDQQLALERATAKEAELNEIIGKELGAEELEIERIYAFDARKKEIEAQLKASTAESSLQGEALKQEKFKINKEKELALLELYNKKELSLLQLQNKKDLEETEKKNKAKALSEKEYEQVLSSTLSNISTLQSSGNKTLVAIGKTAALAQLAISGPVAFGKALELGPIIGPPLAAATAIAFAGQAAKVAGVAFEGGGVVGQQGASVGPDNRVAQIRDGELVLNANQQKSLFDAINSGRLGGGDIVVTIDSREIARAVRSQVQGGFVLN